MAGSQSKYNTEINMGDDGQVNCFAMMYCITLFWINNSQQLDKKYI